MLQLSVPNDALLPVLAAMYADAFSQPPWCESYEPSALVEYLSAFSRSEARRCYVLTDDDRPVGVALCTIVPCPDAPFLRVEDLCIDITLQRQGFGSAFLSLLRQEAQSLGCDCIMLSTQRGYPAHGFYLRNGYQEIDSVQLYQSLQ